jgi:hypothetical protein
VRPPFSQNPENIAQLTNEVKLMSELSHPGIVRVHASETRPAAAGGGMEILVVMEFCPGGHLLARINKQQDSGVPLPYTKVGAQRQGGRVKANGAIIAPQAATPAGAPARPSSRAAPRSIWQRRAAGRLLALAVRGAALFFFPPCAALLQHSRRPAARHRASPPAAAAPEPAGPRPSRTATSSSKTCSSPPTAPRCGCATLAARARTAAR